MRELFTEGLPGEQRDGFSTASYEDASAGMVVSRAAAAAWRGGHGVGRQCLGPESDALTPSRECLEDEWGRVREARERSEARLRLALTRRASSRLSTSRASAQTSTTPEALASLPPYDCCSSSSEDETVIWKPPRLRFRAAGTRASPLPRASQTRQCPGAAAGGGGASSCGRGSCGGNDVGVEARFEDFVPAVFPFPEPIPKSPPVHGPSYPVGVDFSRGADKLAAEHPGRRDTPASHINGLRCGARCHVALALPLRSKLRFELPEEEEEDEEDDNDGAEAMPVAGKMAKPRGSAGSGRARPSTRSTAEDPLFDENRERANGWISECAPKVWLLEHERPVWMQTKRWIRSRRKEQEAAYRNMPSMPFDLWLRMKHSLEKKAARRAGLRNMVAESETDADEMETRDHFMRLASSRKQPGWRGGEAWAAEDRLAGMARLSQSQSQSHRQANCYR